MKSYHEVDWAWRSDTSNVFAVTMRLIGSRNITPERYVARKDINCLAAEEGFVTCIGDFVLVAKC